MPHKHTQAIGSAGIRDLPSFCIGGRIGLAPGLFLVLLLTACGDLLVHTPTSRYGGHVVRGVVTDIYTREQLAANWDKMAREVSDAPPRAEYVDNYRRVAVRIERLLGGATFAYPFVPRNLTVSVGDVVDFPIQAPKPRLERFSERGEILRVICRHDDSECLVGTEGSRRGVVN